MSKPHTVTVRILEKDYQVACPQDQEAELLVSAKYLDKQMRGIRDSGKVIGLERIAVMAALNISHELLRASEEPEMVELPPAVESVNRLNRKLDDALYHLRQLEIG
ncbi:MAG: cell division protein ZapA [Halioglobus sp.]|nr:cell division protein ZapA [Halioglobus sp.]MCB1708914.1 cell division protein ZapA [Halioglobus sp.]MCP5121340.1 cell division protein ZapA [Pseudomonadales bacterium]MCP5193320.1 cell division protein ZapA [Pseudomonadales bacterium]